MDTVNQRERADSLTNTRNLSNIEEANRLTDAENKRVVVSGEGSGAGKSQISLISKEWEERKERKRNINPFMGVLLKGVLRNGMVVRGDGATAGNSI